MKIRNPFSNSKAMSQEPEKQSEVQENSLSDEIRPSSDVEASEQKPLEEDPIGRLEKEISELKDNHLRLYAEFENYKRRSVRERVELIKTAGSDILTSPLPTLDDFERAIKAMGPEIDQVTREGIVLIHQKLLSSLEQKGLKAMESIGKEFDVELHEAITKIPVEDPVLKGKNVDEVEKGYWLNDKVLRYAKVVVGS